MTASAITNYEDLAKEMIEDIEESKDELIYLSKIIAYEGLDFKTIIAKLRSREPDFIVFKADVGQMIKIFLCRGNNVHKILHSMSGVGKQRVYDLVRKNIN
ncbi:unnamed protein product [Lepeophtheirus salmonis]|uniref:(salmon louse) hypothetical protein n=1 Tax=Lepeophtheirus salmonis TaxID=72036 RepID=A0A7R8D8H4_LEPSM|nr:unnamed protein product [Lepeophtheirus salmonis]CAF3035291.1 unnamed protein product [Lepeophtheirus salmonis]